MSNESLRQGLLDQHSDRANSIGVTVDIIPNFPPNNGHLFTQDFPTTIQNTAKEPRNPLVATICCDAYPIDTSGFPSDGALSANCTAFYIYAVCRFGAGAAQSGFGAKVIGPVVNGAPELFDENIFDIGLGSIISLPLGMETINIRYIALNSRGGGFNGNVPLPSMRVSIFLGYGNKVNTATFTDPLPGALGVGATAVFARPKYASEVSFLYDVYGSGSIQSIRLRFFTLAGNLLLEIPVPNGSLPIPRIPWPQGSYFVEVLHTGGAPLTSYQNFVAVNYLIL